MAAVEIRFKHKSVSCAAIPVERFAVDDTKTVVPRQHVRVVAIYFLTILLVSMGMLTTAFAQTRLDEVRPLINGLMTIQKGSDLIERIPENLLVPGQAYSLRLQLNKRSGPGTANIVFRIPEWNQSYRTFSTPIQPSTNSVELSFIAPDFVRLAELKLSAVGRRNLRIDQVELKTIKHINVTQSIASNADSYVPNGYVLVFNDEFNGQQLDRKKWFTRFIYENETLDFFKDERQRYRDNNNHVVESGKLKLIARAGKGNIFESGMIRSDWTGRYGYYEARVKMPNAKGVFAAFWLNADVPPDGNPRWPPEIDIFEFVNNGGAENSNVLHSGVVPNANTTVDIIYAHPDFNRKWSAWTAPFRFDQDWHTIGVEWTEASVATFVDGRKIVERMYPWRYADGRLAAKAAIIMNLAIGGEWAGRNGIDYYKFPAIFQIDWVRAYQKPVSQKAQQSNQLRRIFKVINEHDHSNLNSSKSK